jgi:site-specific DNA-cytosine methylase
VEIFGGIGTELAAMLEAGLTVRRYVYVDNLKMSTRVARHHLHQLMLLYPQQLHPTAIRGCFSCLPRDVTLISEADLRHLGPMDMVIADWPCQGHSSVGAGRG